VVLRPDESEATQLVVGEIVLEV